MENEDGQLDNPHSELDIAVIGMSGRFPGAKTVDEFWQNLASGTESITFFSDKELLEAGVPPALLDDPAYVKAAPFLDGIEYFDAAFFKFSPREAEMTDPQQRVFLECAWETLENAGYDAERYGGSIAVYAGASLNLYMMSTGIGANLRIPDMSTFIGNDKDYLATRVSYKMNLNGPSMTVGSACSTSLVAIHLACQSLLNQECDMALAGGVSILFPWKAGYLYREGDIGSPDGHCRAFDASAQGTVFGCGAGAVLLKRLDDAIADGDNIYTVIRVSAINNDGSEKVGYTAPSVEGQSRVIVEALANAGVEADTISYIEAHGTGTALGDPIEVAALTKAFRNFTDKKGFCHIGSVKTNIGHLDVAAGVTSFIKTTLAMNHKMIPPTLHFQKPNPEIDFDNSPFHVNNELVAWEAPYPRRAGISSFGLGGTNAHVIIEEAPVARPSGASRPWQLLLISARTGTALDTATQNLSGYFANHHDINLADAAYTLQVGRKAFNHRRMLVCRDIDDAANTLGTPDDARILSSCHDDAQQKDVVFVFSGQGSQYINMGLDLYRTEPVFREEMDRCFRILRSRLGLDLHGIIYPQGAVTEGAAEKLTQTMYTQPALFAIEYSLAKLWMSWGIHPSAMVGHSIGEYVAACLAGVFSLEDALAVVAARGRMMQELPGGSMLAVFLSEKELEPFLGEKVDIAVVNLPSQCVVSGDKEAVAELEKRLLAEKVVCRHVLTSHAFHSRMMEPILGAFAGQVGQVPLRPPEIPFVSNVSGTWITPDEAVNPEYWAGHLRRTIRFSDAIEELLKEPNRIFLEVGPGNVFSSMVRQHPAMSAGNISLASTPHPKENAPGAAYILNTLGQLWLADIPVDWPGFYAGERRRRLPLPTYPFERQYYYMQRPQSAGVMPPAQDGYLPTSCELPAAAGEQAPDTDRVEGEEDVLQTLTELWRRVLGVRHPKPADNFFELGGNSLIAVQLFNRIEKVFNKRLSIATLYQVPTLEGLSDFIRDGASRELWTSLVEMKPGSSGPPLFLVHAGGGNVLIYHGLVNYLDIEQPVYGFQSQGLDCKQTMQTRIEDIAAQYIREMQTVQPQGPYLLAGFCMGGTVAFEMARQLQAQGQVISMLTFMETYIWSQHPPISLPGKLQYYGQKVLFNWGRLISGEKDFIKRRIDLIKEKIALWNETLKSKKGFEFRRENGQHSLLYLLEEANDTAAIEYVPSGKFQGKIIHFIPTREYKHITRNDPGWDAFTSEGTEVYHIPAYPRQMLVEPFVPMLADKLKDCIKKATG